MLYEKVLDDLLVNQDKLTETDRVKLSFTLSDYILTKIMVVIDKITLEKLKEISSQSCMDKYPDPKITFQYK